MAKCPKCKKEIDYLRLYVPCEQRYDFGRDGNPEYRDTFVTPDGEETFDCPECGVVLFTDEDKALTFLKGGMVDESEDKDG